MADSFALPAPLSTYGLDPAQNAELLAPAIAAPTIDTSGASTANPTAALIANQSDLIDNQVARLPTQASIGHQNILDAYNSAFNTLTNQQNNAQRDYNTGRSQTIQDRTNANNAIDTSTRDALSGIGRLLGISGAGNSSAAQVLAPYAAARQGAAQRGQVATTFDRNLGGLDTGWNDALTQFGNAFGQLTTDRTNKDRSLDSSIDQTKSNLLAKKQYLTGDPSLTGQIDDLGHQIDQLGATTTFTPQIVNPKPVDLSNYDYTRFNAPSLGSNVNPALADNVGAFWTLLQGKDKQKANPVGV